jgi:hypothetical protein
MVAAMAEKEAYVMCNGACRRLSLGLSQVANLGALRRTRSLPSRCLTMNR